VEGYQGSRHRSAGRVFWDVRNPDKSVVIQLRNERYARLIVEVEDPSAIVAAIKQTLV
jgi:hypothetical protein